jgi:hypothetical protein
MVSVPPHGTMRHDTRRSTAIVDRCLETSGFLSYIVQDAKLLVGGFKSGITNPRYQAHRDHHPPW